MTFREQCDYLQSIYHRLDMQTSSNTIQILSKIESLLRTVDDYELDILDPPSEVATEIVGQFRDVHDFLIEISGVFTA